MKPTPIFSPSQSPLFQLNLKSCQADPKQMFYHRSTAIMNTNEEGFEKKREEGEQQPAILSSRADLSNKLKNLQIVELKLKNKFVSPRRPKPRPLPFNKAPNQPYKARPAKQKQQQDLRKSVSINKRKKPDFLKLSSKKIPNQEVPELDFFEVYKGLASQRDQILATGENHQQENIENSIFLKKEEKSQKSNKNSELQFQQKDGKMSNSKDHNKSRRHSGSSTFSRMSLNAPMSEKIDFVMSYAQENNLNEMTFEELRSLFLPSLSQTGFKEFSEIRKIQAELQVVYEFMHEIDLDELESQEP